MRDRAAVEQAIATLPATFSAIDVLVNNAGLAKGLQPAQQADPDDWQQMLDTNCAGLLHCSRAILPGMVTRGRGHLINLGSIAGTYPYPGGNVYGATKAFVRQFSLNLRSDLHGTRVRVTCIEPGMSGGTEFSTVRFQGEDVKARAVYSDMRPLTADDIAASVNWAATQPAHVNINTIELMPVDQSFGPVPSPPHPRLTCHTTILTRRGERPAIGRSSRLEQGHSVPQRDRSAGGRGTIARHPRVPERMSYADRPCGT